MTDIENVLSSMSTAFNSSPTPGDEASVIDLNNDNTLKWRRHFNNQYAKKNTRKSGVDEEMVNDEKKTASDNVGEEAKGQGSSAIVSPKAPTPNKQQPEESAKVTPPSTPIVPVPPAIPAITATATSDTTEITNPPSTMMQTAPECPDNDVISASNKDQQADATPVAISGGKAHKPKKSPRTVQESPSRRSNRTRTVQSISPAPLRRRGRSKKVEDLEDNESAVKEEQIQPESKPTSPIRSTEEAEKGEKVEEVESKEKNVEIIPTEKVVEVIVDNKEDAENKESDKLSKVDTNGDVELSDKIVQSTLPKTRKEEVLPVAGKNRKRRSMRFDPKRENSLLSTEKSSPTQPTEKLLKTPEEQPAEKLPKNTEESAQTSPKKEPLDDPPSDQQINSLGRINEKTPKKRGRRAKPVISPATSSSDVPIQTKKTQRQTGKESDENSIQEKTPSKEKLSQNNVSNATKPTVTSQRPLRRIKPTAKILENEELRYEFESKNIARIVATTTGGASNESTKPALVNSADPIRSSTRTREAKDIVHVELKNHVTPNKKKINYLNVDNIYPRNSKPCPEPQDFLNEIKAAGINLHRSPEDKKLNRKQHRKLIKQKEKLFERLGLRRNNREDFTESENSSSDNEEFIPSKKINVGKPNVTLRIRNNKENTKGPTTSAQETPKPSQPPGPPPPKKVVVSHVVPNNEPPSPPQFLKDLMLICSCQAKPKFYARKSTENVYCKAIDHVEDHRVGCFNKVQNSDAIPLYRPSPRVPYLLLCEQHLVRFLSHNSCAGCGVFCTQGSFILCKHRHFFHPGCAQKLILNTPYDPSKRSTYPSPKLVLKCPHCGCDTSEKESLVTMKCQNTPVFLPSQKGPIKPAKMGSTPTNGNRLSIVRKSPQECIDLAKYIPESVMNIVVREGGISLNDFTTKDMFYAVNNDDLERVAEIIRSGFDIASEMKEFLDGTCLHLVAHFGTIQMACLLLARNSYPSFLNHRDKELRTAAMCSIIGDKCDILQLFIQVGADISLKGTDGMTCLHFAARSGNLQAAKIILENYSSSVGFKQFNNFLNARDDGGWTSLVWACELGHTSIVSLLLNYGADPSICDMENNTALLWAVMSSCQDIMKILLQANAPCNVQNINGDTPLHIACRQMDTSAALILIARGADLLIKNNDGQIPYDCIRDEEDPCARAVGFNMQMRSIGPTGLQAKVICSDISNGRELYPIEVVRRPKISKMNNDIDDETILPDFKYITKSILLQNSVQIDCRVSQMRICSCNDSCNSEKCQCSTISVQNWYTAEGRLNGEFNFDDPPMIFECNDVCGCNKLICKNRVVQNGMKNPLQVFECQQRAKGWGVRTLRAIPRGNFVAEYMGEILTDMEADRRTDDSYFFDLGSSEHCIDANYYGNVSRFFNHSCSPNIVPVRVYYEHQDYRFPKIAFFACKNIAVGEEIAFDYGEKFWAVKQKYFTCKCESSECRFASQTDRIQQILTNGSEQSAASSMIENLNDN